MEVYLLLKVVKPRLGLVCIPTDGVCLNTSGGVMRLRLRLTVTKQIKLGQARHKTPPMGPGPGPTKVLEIIGKLPGLSIKSMSLIAFNIKSFLS